MNAFTALATQQVQPDLLTETLQSKLRNPEHTYPRLAAGALDLLKCDDSVESVQNAIRQWNADDLEKAGSETGLVFAKVRTFEEFSQEAQYTDVLSRVPLIKVEKFRVAFANCLGPVLIRGSVLTLK
jgi:hypothetical protein